MVAVREGWKSELNESRVSRAESWIGSVRRVESIVGWAEGGGHEVALGSGGCRRDSQVARSLRRLF